MNAEYLKVQALELAEKQDLILCDPLTGLLAYNSFARYLVRMLPIWTAKGAHLAIGDVDGLKEYVTSANADNPNLFGHLAGNKCMETIGKLVREWLAVLDSGWEEVVCGTFGGDEVIIAAVGQDDHAFSEIISSLCRQIRLGAPRPCSFVCCSSGRLKTAPSNAAEFYEQWVSTADRALFRLKEDTPSQCGQILVVRMEERS